MPMTYVLREAEMPILPAGHDDIRILHFSDLHLTPARKKEIADIKSFISLKPDLVISTGDFLACFSGHEAEILSAQFTANGKLIVSSSADMSIRVWSPIKQECI